MRGGGVGRGPPQELRPAGPARRPRRRGGRARKRRRGVPRVLRRPRGQALFSHSCEKCHPRVASSTPSRGSHNFCNIVCYEDIVEELQRCATVHYPECVLDDPSGRNAPPSVTSTACWRIFLCSSRLPQSLHIVLSLIAVFPISNVVHVETKRCSKNRPRQGVPMCSV